MFNFLKRKLVWFIFLAVLGLGGVSLWYLNRDSDEAQVRETLRELCRIASRQADEGAGSGLLKMRMVEKVFAPECRIDFHHELFGGTYKVEEIASSLARARAMFRTCTVNFRDLSITIDPPNRATAYFTGTLDARLNDGKTVNEVRDLECKLKKIDNHWLITDIAVRDVLEK